MNIKTIAVCIYGQHRTGNIVLPHIKQQFDLLVQKGYQVDYICSIKESSEQSVEEIESFMKDVLDAKFVSVYTRGDIRPTPPYSYVTDRIDSMIDCLMAKQIYEVENDISYDLVIPLRPDVLISPFHYFRDSVDRIVAASSERPHTHSVYSTDTVIANRLLPQIWNLPVYGDAQPWLLYPENINDLCFFLTGTASDRLCMEMITTLAYNVEGMYGNRNVKYINEENTNYEAMIFSPHNFIVYHTARISIDNPFFLEVSDGLRSFMPNRPFRNFQTIPVRYEFYDESMDLKDPDTVLKLQNLYIKQIDDMEEDIYKDLRE